MPAPRTTSYPADIVATSKRAKKGIRWLLNDADNALEDGYNRIYKEEISRRIASQQELQNLRRMYERLAAVRADLGENLHTWQGSYGKLIKLLRLRGDCIVFLQEARKSTDIIKSMSNPTSGQSSPQATSPYASSTSSTDNSTTYPFRSSSSTTSFSVDSLDEERRAAPQENEVNDLLEYLNSYPEKSGFAQIILGLALSVNNDWSDFASKVACLLGDREKAVEDVKNMPPHIIKVALNLLQRAIIGYDLNEGRDVSDSFREDCEFVLRRVSQKSGALPTCLNVVVTFGDRDDAYIDVGASASVYKATMGDTVVAVKMFHKGKHQARGLEVAMKKFRREAIVWKQLNHENILPLLGVCGNVPGFGVAGLVSPYCEQGNLTDYISEHKECDRLYMLERIAGALSHLHSHDPPIVHRDLKGRNIVMWQGEPRLTDFGITTFSQSFTVTSEKPGDGTVQFQAPETLKPEDQDDAPDKPKDSSGKTEDEMTSDSERLDASGDDIPSDTRFDEQRRQLTPACDMYSFACLCIEIYTLRLPWGDLNNITVATRVLQNRRPPRPAGDTVPPAVWSLIEACWPQEPQDRLTSDAVQHALRAMLEP
ncbi:kinase-like protein [Heliocybe sulcata]|uniref:Kinase-like protein n=1 Tax=Heliocybe sulcata TaxID=5364 RepID=A0A5C3NAJ7_9AGAM|nr:kinase-like protein [Heliocybe sulcata]